MVEEPYQRVGAVIFCECSLSTMCLPLSLPLSSHWGSGMWRRDGGREGRGGVPPNPHLPQPIASLSPLQRRSVISLLFVYVLSWSPSPSCQITPPLPLRTSLYLIFTHLPLNPFLPSTLLLLLHFLTAAADCRFPGVEEASDNNKSLLSLHPALVAHSMPPSPPRSLHSTPEVPTANQRGS